jgi:4-hydroxybenzoyl-CoA reductase beta subunit
MSGKYFLPTSVSSAAELLRAFGSQGGALAGGTDVMLSSQQGLMKGESIVDLSLVTELRGLKTTDTGIEIGSMVTLAQLERSEFVERRFRIIAQAASSVASPVIRQSATIGGNLLVGNRCTYYNQSKFWRNSIGSCLKDTGDTCRVTGIRNGRCYARNISDMAPALIALYAKASFLVGGRESQIPLEELYSADGLLPLGGVTADALLLRVEVPAPPEKSFFRKLRLRKSVDFSSLTVAGARDKSGAVRICLNAIAMAPILISGHAKGLDMERVIHEARIKSKIVDNDVLPIEYRKEMMTLFLRELWAALELS